LESAAAAICASTPGACPSLVQMVKSGVPFTGSFRQPTGTFPWGRDSEVASDGDPTI
jgi:hypothetical protein